MSENQDYDHAVDIRDTKRAVYAMQVHEELGDPPMGSIMNFPDAMRCIPHGWWVVWWEENGEAYYTDMPDAVFQERYVTGDGIPASIRAQVEARETYREWVERMNGERVTQ